MKVCDSFLKIWTNPSLTTQEMIHQFTMAGLEVDECLAAAPAFEGVVVAEVMETKKHPEADKLTVCQINNGIELVQVVCGAANVRPGLKVALAKPGALLPNNINIGQAKLRGEISLGMLCSAVELGCADESDGIWELPKDAPVGQDFRDYLQLDEQIYSFELTPNRGDCFSALGLARELAAITNSAFKPLDIPVVPATHDETIHIEVQHSEWNPLYCGRKIKNIRPYSPTPMWLKEKIRRLGLRSVHPVVDVLNYVMFLFGQPMHAFDLHKIGGRIVVREAEQGEKINLLNGKEVELNQGTPVITNGEKPIAIAGVMGSIDSAVDDDTSEIFLESAFFHPIKLSGVARQYGLSTDASIRYERGVDACLAQQAMEYATALLTSIVGGEPGPVQVIVQKSHLPVVQNIQFYPELFTKRTGIPIENEQILDLLARLHFIVDANQVPWVIEAPSYRFDITEAVDIVEEILRIYGYDNIPSVAIQASLQPGSIDKLESIQNSFSQTLCNLGYYEAVNYAFVDHKLQHEMFPEHDAIQLLNPISPELSEMRLSLWPGLIHSLIHNTNRQQTSLQLFEGGVVFAGTATEAQESAHVAGLIYGDAQQMNWLQKGQEFDFFDAKAHVEHLLIKHGYQDIKFVQASHPSLHPGQTASVSVHGVSCGWVGALHPKLQSHFDLLSVPILWQINLSVLPELVAKKYIGLSKFPQTRRDISFLIHKNVQAIEIVECIRQAVSSDILKDVHIFDVYHGKELADDMVSVAVACIFQDWNKTLVEQDILSYQSAILKILTEKFGIKLRDGQ